MVDTRVLLPPYGGSNVFDEFPYKSPGRRGQDIEKRSGNTNVTNMSILRVSLLVAMAVAATSGAPLDHPEPIPILQQNQDGPNPDGSYSWNYETANGIQAQEQGSLVPSRQSNEESISTKGSYSYTADDGTPIQVTYIANEDGFQPQGAHLPVAPPIPPAILRALEWIAAHPEEDNL